MPETRSYIIKLIVSGAKKCEEEAQQWIDSFGKLGYIPIKIAYGNSFQDVIMFILFKKEGA